MHRTSNDNEELMTRTSINEDNTTEPAVREAGNPGPTAAPRPSLRDHWQDVYERKAEDEVSWLQP
jgi:hypothetical protein